MNANKWIEFREVSTKNKTRILEVLSISDGSKLGEIKWHVGYRKYAFFVTSVVTIDREKWGFVTFNADTKIFDTGCLDEISQFIKELMAKRNKL